MLPSWHNDGVDWIGIVNDDVGGSILGCLDVEVQVGCLHKSKVKVLYLVITESKVLEAT